MFVTDDLYDKRYKYSSLNDLREAGLTTGSDFGLYTQELKQMCLDNTRTDYLSMNECSNYGIAVNNRPSTDGGKLVPVFNCSILNPICLAYRNVGISGEGTITKVSGRNMKSSDNIYAVVKIKVELNNSNKYYIFNYSSSTIVQGSSVSLSYYMPDIYENGTFLNNKSYYGDEFNNANSMSYDVYRISIYSVNLYGTGIQSYTYDGVGFRYSVYRGKDTGVSSTTTSLIPSNAFSQATLLAWNRNGASKNIQIYISPAMNFSVTMETGIPKIVVTSADYGTCIVHNVPDGTNVWLNFVIEYAYTGGGYTTYGHYYSTNGSITNGTYNGTLYIYDCYGDAAGTAPAHDKNAYTSNYVGTLSSVEAVAYNDQHIYEITKIHLKINNNWQHTSQFSITHAGFYYSATYGGYTVNGYKEDVMTAETDLASLFNRTPLSGEDYISVTITPRVEITLL